MRVFVTDGDSRAALAVTRSLGRAGHHVLVGDRKRSSLAGSSRYCREAVVYPDPVTAPEAFIDGLDRILREKRVDVLVPIADVALILAIGNRHRLPDACTIPFAAAHAIGRAANKVDIVQTAARLGVPVPRTVVVPSHGRVPAFDFGFPVVIKPRQSRIRTRSGWVSSAVSFAQNAEELDKDLASRPAYEFPLLLQEKIAGPGVGVFTCYRDGRPATFFSHRRLRERPPWGGVSVLSESARPSADAVEYSKRLLDELGWQGVAMVEFKQDERDGQPKLMEINGRFWGSLQLAIDAGVDFPALLVDSARPAPEGFAVGVRTRWFWGDVDSLLVSLFGGKVAPTHFSVDRGRVIRDFLKFWGRGLHYDNPKWSDPWPWFVESYAWCRDMASRAVPRLLATAGGGLATQPLVAAGSTPALTAPAAAAPADRVAELPLRAEIAGSLDAVGLAAGDWNALAATGETNSIFQTYEWAQAWWRAYGTHYDPLLVKATRSGRIVGVAPVVVQRDHSDRVLRFLGDGRADYCDVLGGGGDAAVCEAMFEALRRSDAWDVMDLRNLPSGSRTLKAAQAMSRRAGYQTLVEDQFICPTLLIRGHEASARAILNKPSLRRRTNHLKRYGELVCRNLTAMEDIEPYLDRFFAQHVARWNGSGAASLFCKEEHRQFYRELARSLSGTGHLLFSIVELDGRPIAFHYGFDYNDTLLWYKPSFDIDYSSKSPGLVLVHHLIGYAVSHNRRELDFTVGDEAFKRRFTNSARKTVRIQVFRNRIRYFVERSKRDVMAAVKRTVASRAVPEQVSAR